MKKTYLLFLIVFLFSFVRQLSAEESTLSKQALFDIYHSTLKELNLPTVDMDKVKYEGFLAVYNPDMHGSKVLIPIVGCKEDGFEMRIDPITGKILTCHSDFIQEKVIGRNAPLFEGGAKPSKKKEDIMRLAEDYFKILNNGKTPKDAYFMEASYDVGRWKDTKRSYEGSWNVFWGRKEGEYKYKIDRIGVHINEKYGLESYGNHFYSDYHPPKNINISEGLAIKTAEKNINKIIRSIFFEGAFSGYKVGKMTSAELMIINPNYAHKKKTYEGDWELPYARLAWVVKFQCIPKGGGPTVSCEAWIDAETGEVLGGG